MSREPRILIVDDDPLVREAYRAILVPPAPDAAMAAARAALFGDAAEVPAFAPELTLVDQGDAAIEAVAAATASGGYAMAFVDMRMPPGIDGVATIERLWTLDSDLQVVVASAWSDTPWDEIARRLGGTDRLLFLKKPFDVVEARQLAVALCRKRQLLQQARQRERTLEAHVAARTRDLARALHSAEAAANVRMQFLANMSHEIRTPLTAILGFAELLRDGACEREVMVEHLATIERNSQHLLQLVNDVLDLSKLEADQLLLEAQPIDLPSLLADVVSSLRAQAFTKGLELTVQPTGPFPRTLVTDGMRLRQILINLVGNAIKFTASGSITLRVGPAGTAAAPAVAIAVVDTGIGIAADRLGALFQPFVQADASTSRRFGGTGLGLSICSRLARLLGGEVTVVSEPGQGSTFTLQVPVAETLRDGRGQPVLQVRDEAAAVAPVEPARPVRLHGRILLAEDGSDNRRLLTAILRKAGAEVVTAGNGVEAVAAVQQAAAAGASFDLVLMDMQMPVMDGYTATRTLRAAGWRGAIVALTAHAMEGDRERCLAEGCDGYETKPVRADRLVAACARFAPGLIPAPAGGGPAATP